MRPSDHKPIPASIPYVIGSLGANGGQFFGLKLAATDSRGNIYTGEVFSNERVQRLVPADSPRGKLLEQLSRLP